MLKDQQNNIWYITNQGLYRYDAIHKHTDYYGVNDGISNAKTRRNASLCSQAGNIYFGTKNGFNIITPSNIKKNPIAPSVYLAGITINNQAFVSGSGAIANSIALTQIKSITLNAEQNTLGFQVICNSYIKPEKNRFKYRLTNYDNNWIEVAQDKNIIFTKVPPGKYIFEAYGSNNDNVWSESSYKLKVTILPPLYRRWYAILIYLLMILAAISYIHKELRIKIKLRKEIAEARYKTQANEQIIRNASSFLPIFPMSSVRLYL